MKLNFIWRKFQHKQAHFKNIIFKLNNYSVDWNSITSKCTKFDETSNFKKAYLLEISCSSVEILITLNFSRRLNFKVLCEKLDKCSRISDEEETEVLHYWNQIDFIMFSHESTSRSINLYSSSLWTEAQCECWEVLCSISALMFQRELTLRQLLKTILMSLKFLRSFFLSARFILYLCQSFSLCIYIKFKRKKIESTFCIYLNLIRYLFKQDKR